MSRWSTLWLLSVFWLVPLGAHAQKLKVLAPASSLEITATSSTSYIEVTGRNGDGDQACSARCEPNVVSCSCVGTGVSSISSRLVYDDTREKLVSCNGETVTSEGAECSLDSGVLSATTHVRLGKLKLVPKAAPGYSGLLLSTSGVGVRLEFAESVEDHHGTGFARDFGGRPKFVDVGAGSYRVTSGDLPAHCLPTQNDPALQVTVGEGQEVELDVLFRGTQCLLTVNRSVSEGSAGGTILTTPAGLSCGAGTSACTGRFDYGTELTITPEPEDSGSYSFRVGDGCVPGNEPCKHTIQSDRTFNVNFNPPSTEEPDAGVPPLDAGSEEGDAGTGSMNDASTEPGDDGTDDGTDDDGTTDGDDDSVPPGDDDGTPGDDGASGEDQSGDGSGDDGSDGAEGTLDAGSDSDESGGSSGCSVSSAPTAASSGAALALGALFALLIRRRRPR
jgi:MYXO-CTERM domain-containing protein